MAERLVVLMTAGSREEADRIADALVAEMLAACVNVLPGATSVYRWEGEMQRDEEWLLVAKSTLWVIQRLGVSWLNVDIEYRSGGLYNTQAK